MAARLTLYLPDHPARALLLEEGPDYVLGRDPSCDPHVNDDRISRRHARLKGRGGSWTLADLGSKNGVLLEGRLVGEPAVIDRESWISFGGLLARFEVLSGEAERRLREGERRRWQTSLELRRQLSPSMGLDPLLRQILDSVLRLTGAERGFILLSTPSGELAVKAAADIGAGDLVAAEFRGSFGAVERVLASGRPVALSDALGGGSFAGRMSVVQGGIRALVCVPLIALERCLGVVYADSRAAGKTFTELDVSILEALISHAALAVSAAQLDDELRGLMEDLDGEPAAWSEVRAFHGTPPSVPGTAISSTEERA